MFNVSETIYKKVEESNFRLGFDTYEKKSDDSKFLDLSPRTSPVIPVRSYFDECGDDYKTDLSFVRDE